MDIKIEIKLIKSIKKFDYLKKQVSPIFYDHIENRIKGGHTRFNACLKLGIQPLILDALGRQYEIKYDSGVIGLVLK